jgi:hypothetical protein
MKMRLLKQAMAVLGTVATVAILAAVISPKSARAVVATLVQIVPGSTTHVGQNEGQLVSLLCGTSATPYCVALDPTGTPASTAYVVPSGYTLIVTDWEWTGNGGAPAGQLTVNFLRNVTGGFLVYSAALVTTVGTPAYDHEHYGTGIRVGSGVTIEDFLAAIGDGQGLVQGYLVPN